MLEKRTFVTVSVQFDGLHCWPSATSFLRHPHQHRFLVQLKVETIPGDNSRSLEFFEVKRELQGAIERAFPSLTDLGVRDLGDCATEAVADRVYDELPERYTSRGVSIHVEEDETQGSITEYPARESQAAREPCVISKEQICHRLATMGNAITEDYADKPSFLMVCLLKGAFVFAADLLRKIEHENLEVSFLRLKSYTGKRRGAIKVIGAVPDVKGKHVLLVDDIHDSGRTLKHAISLVKKAGAVSVRVAVLLCRSKGLTPAGIDYCGFVLKHDAFVAGYGLDVDEKLRQIPHVFAAAFDPPLPQ